MWGKRRALERNAVSIRDDVQALLQVAQCSEASVQEYAHGRGIGMDKLLPANSMLRERDFLSLLEKRT